MKKKALPAAQARTGTRVPARQAQGKVSARTKGVKAKAGKAEGGGRQAESQKLEVRREKSEVKAAGKSARAAVKKAEVRHEKSEARGPEVALGDGQQERFCRLMADGRFSGRSCYAQAFGCENEGSAKTLASRLLTKVDIRARIDWLKRESLKTWTCEKEEVMRFLHQVITTPVGYVDEESPLAQEVTREEMQMGGARGQLKRGQADSGNEDESPEVEVTKVKIKIPGKVEAAKLLAQMQGWEKPKELVLTMDYEPPSKAIERAKAKNLDLAGILAKAGLLGGGRKGA